MRSFHNYVDYEGIFAGKNLYLELSEHYQDVVDDIFATNFESVKFRQFRNLWKHINGENSMKSSKSGGSHRKLLDQYGNFLGATFAHGNNHEYTKSTIPYLIDALIRSSVWPQ